jgi:hypothetical protein
VEIQFKVEVKSFGWLGLWSLQYRWGEYLLTPVSADNAEPLIISPLFAAPNLICPLQIPNSGPACISLDLLLMMGGECGG